MASAVDGPHQPFDDLLQELSQEGAGRVGGDAFGRVLSRVLISNPTPVAQVDIANGAMLTRRIEISPTTVSRAVSAMRSCGLLHPVVGQTASGRASIAFGLQGSELMLAGVHLETGGGLVQGVHGVLTDLSGAVLTNTRSDLSSESADTQTVRAIASAVASAVARMLDDVGAQAKDLLGVGVEVGGHVSGGRLLHYGHVGIVEDAPLAGLIAECLAEMLPDRQSNVPVILQNDVNALAIHRAYSSRVRDRDFAVVAVLGDGIGSAFIRSGRLYAGVSGAAGELGHIKVPRPERWPIADEICGCGEPGHLECFASPSRVLRAAEVVCGAAPGSFNLTDVARQRPDEAGKTVYELFAAGGEALGTALATMATLVDPGRIHVLVPQELLGPDETPGRAYLNAADTALAGAFSTTSQASRGDDGKLLVEALPPPDERAERSALAAAVCVLDALIEHFRGRDGCQERASQIVSL